jgi:hypothetical protein
MDNNAAATDAWSDTLDFGDVLEDLVREISHAACSCTALQWSISTLLEKVDHPDLAAEIRMLQDVDRLQQTLDDIAAILAIGTGAGRGLSLSRRDVGEAIRLESLRRRMRLGTVAVAPDEEDTESDDITWF